MVDKKFIVAAIGVIVALGAVGPSFAQMFQHAEAHGVQAQLQSRFVRIDDETWSKQSVQTGDTLTDSGKFTSLVNRDLRGWYTVYGDSPNAGNRWEIVARDPPGNVITIPANGVVPYKLTIRGSRASSISHAYTAQHRKHRSRSWSRTNNSRNRRPNRKANSIYKHCISINNHRNGLCGYICNKTLASDLKKSPPLFSFS